MQEIFGCAANNPLIIELLSDNYVIFVKMPN